MTRILNILGFADPIIFQIVWSQLATYILDLDLGVLPDGKEAAFQIFPFLKKHGIGL